MPQASPFSSQVSSAADDAAEDWILELAEDGTVRESSGPGWSHGLVPEPGARLADQFAEGGIGWEEALARTHDSGRPERIRIQLGGKDRRISFVGRLIPLPGRKDGGWLLHLRKDSHDDTVKLLEASDGFLHRAVEQLSLGVTLSDPSGRIAYVNRAEAAMHGYGPEELIGAEACLLGSPESSCPPPPERISEDALWSRRRINRRRDGTEFPIRLVSDDIRDEDGRVVGRITISEDISERERTREELARRDRILDAVHLAAERFLAASDWETEIDEVLVRLATATGASTVYTSHGDDFRSGSHHLWSREVEPESPEAVAVRKELVLRGQDHLRADQPFVGDVRDVPTELRVRLAEVGIRSFALVPVFVQSVLWGLLGLEDGGERSWSRAELDALRTAARILGATLRAQQDRQALDSSHRLVRELLETASDLVVSFAPNGRLQMANRAFRRAVGLDADEGSGLTCTLFDLVHKPYRDSLRDRIEEVSKSGASRSVKTVLRGVDGSRIVIEGDVSARRVRGRSVALQGIFRDVTERDRLDRMKHQFIQVVSHELRTPLTPILTSLALLKGEGEPAPRVRKALQVAERNTRHLLALIGDLLDLQKVISGQLELNPQPVPVVDLIREMERARELSDRLRTEVGVEVTSVLADRDRLLQVLGHLVSNALKFSPPAEPISISAHRWPDSTTLAVTDRGPGVPRELRSRLFDPLTQGDGSSTRRAGGIGLGLGLSKALVELMAGTLEVVDGPGPGTTVIITLPNAPADEPPGSPD